ncbi:hypothetical protein ACP70R_040209 [Stipagrostis hirtigluma subsp. patula]
MGTGRRGRRRRGGGSGGGSKRPRSAVEEEAEAEEAGDGEDDCFVCKDGGKLRLCDFRSCHKAYHPGCVGKDNDFLNSDETFICQWHTCFICDGRSRYYCYCCPRHSFCQVCVKQAEFVPVIRKTKGFCSNCLRLVIMIERNVDVDSDGERVDFNDRDTYEFFFKEYWDIVKEKEGLTLDNLEEAYKFMKGGRNSIQDSDLEELPDEERKSDDDFLGHSDDGDDEPSRPTDLYRTSKKVKVFRKEGRSKKNVHKEALLAFLSSIGKDTTKSLDQFGATEVVKEYIQQKGLLQKDKKKTVICDDRLRSLFKKSKLKYNRIYCLLERHTAGNQTSEDEVLSSSEDNDDSVMTKKARTVSYESNTPKRTAEINRRCFASLVRDNIKLIYLKRSLVMDLLKEPDTFENKVIGCFVRIKNDLKEYCYHMPKKLYQLGQVTGIRKASEEYKIRDISTNVLLHISNISEVKISVLSDEDFEEEECEDLRLLAQKGSFKRLTVGDLEEKAISIRRDLVNHRISKELQRLDKLIEISREKHMERRNLLRGPSERERLLDEFPHVIPDMEDSKDSELQVTAQDKSIQTNRVAFQGTNGVRTCLKHRTEEYSKGTDWKGALSLKSRSEEKPKGTDGGRALSLKSSSEAKSKGSQGISSSKIDTERTPEVAKADADDVTAGRHVQQQGTEAVAANAASDIPYVQRQNTEGTNANDDSDTPTMQVERQSAIVTKVNTADDTPENFVQKQGAEASDARMTTQVIVIEDDEEDDLSEEGRRTTVADPDARDARDTRPVQHEANNSRDRAWRMRVWYYNDPHGDEQGPFTMEHLHAWWNGGYFPENFRVWRTGQTSDSAILLRDALRLTG